ncbi:DUF4263 domain-containing protein [Candidatus Peregrinibacteria bacterium]|nr:DUF4263 domain-containing protein [Candidatus Peregrinibacteria bacterium]
MGVKLNENNGVIFKKPATYLISLEKEKGSTLLGKIQMEYQLLPEYTDKDLNFIKNDPMAMKNVRFTIACNKCDDFIKPYVGLKKDDELAKKDQLIWYKDVPDQFICGCGKTIVDLKYIKQNFHALLGRRGLIFQNNGSFEMDFNKSAFIQVITDFKKLVEDETKAPTGEATLQDFIEKNPIVLSCFSPELIEPKAPIGSKYETDFALINQKKELILIEIEKPSTKLFKAKGGRHSEVGVAFDQVEDWLKECREDKLGVIRNLKMEGVKNDDICEIRGVIIAGRTKEEDMEYMGKLLNGHKHIDFFTYDHLIEQLIAISRSLRDL